MSETTYSVDQDLREAKAMVQALVPYVYEDQLYGKVGTGGFFSGGKMPALTIGALLMRLQRLRAMEENLTAPQRGQLKDIEAQNESVRREWSPHYEGKMLLEARSRLRAIEQWFVENKEDPKAASNAYLPEAHRRTIVEILAETIAEPNEELDRHIRRVDSGLRRWTEPASFVWSRALEPFYPKLKYWWLYVKPAAKVERKVREVQQDEDE